MSPKASIIIPVYNAEKTLRKCVESIVLGNERDIEVILCEDCSRDNSWEICRRLATEYIAVTCIQNDKNRGVSYTRNQGLNLAKAEYILFVDSDDWVAEDYVSDLLSLAKNQSGALPICGHCMVNKSDYSEIDYVFYNTSSILTEIPNTLFLELYNKTLLQTLWNKIFRRDIIENNKIRFVINQSMGEDFRFVLDYIECSKIVKCIYYNKILYYYSLDNDHSLTSEFGFNYTQESLISIDRLINFIGNIDNCTKENIKSEIKNTYLYHISKNKIHTKVEKLQAIERIMCDGKARGYYRRQRIIHIKEKIFSLLIKIKQKITNGND